MDMERPFASSRAASARALLSLRDDYGDEAARELAAVLEALAAAGFAKARARDYSVFDRILGGVCWLLQRAVKREDAARGRVQWELLFQSHDKMKPRLGLAQEVVRRVDALPLAPPQRLQAHQLLLQDFGDIGAVRRLVEWLVELESELGYLDAIRAKREYLKVGNAETPQEELKREVKYLQRAYEPRRKYQYTTADDEDESEDALIQKCLLEFGERVAVAAIVDADAGDENEQPVDATPADPMSLMAQLAAASAAAAVTRREGGRGETTATKKARIKMTKDAREFEKQYQRIVQQAAVEQKALLEKQRAREVELLQHVVALPDVEPFDVEGAELSEEIKAEQEKLREYQLTLATLEDVKRRMEAQHTELIMEQAEIDKAFEELESESKRLDREAKSNPDAQLYLPQLRALVSKNESLKKQKADFKATCKKELEELQARVEQLRQQTQDEAAQQDEETRRLNEIEELHTQLAGKHKDLKLALGHQTRELHKRMKQIDDIPTRIELIQYEKRFLELYDEVALTLDETRKYYNVYNTLKTTHEFLEKEISLINSMHDNFDLAMASKAATQAFFSQLDSIIQNVQNSVRKQQTLRADHQGRVETLDSKYQMLLEKERMYVNAIREFQKECEKNEKLTSRVAQYRHHAEQAAKMEKSGTDVGVSADDVVI